MNKWNIYTSIFQKVPTGSIYRVSIHQFPKGKLHWLRPSLRVYRVVWRPSSQRLPVTPSMLWDVPPYQHLGTSCHSGIFGPNVGKPHHFFSERHNFRDVFSEMLGSFQLFGFDSGPYLHDFLSVQCTKKMVSRHFSSFLNARTWLWDSEKGGSQIFPQVPKTEPLQDSQFPPSTPSTPPSLPLANSKKTWQFKKMSPQKFRARRFTSSPWQFPNDRWVGDFLEHLFELRSHVNSLTIPENFTRIAQAQLIFNRDCIWSSHLQYGILIMSLL